MDRTQIDAGFLPRDKSDSRDEQNAFTLSCFRTLGPAPAAKCPLGAVRDWHSATKALAGHGLLPILGVAMAGASATSSVRQLVLRNTLRTALNHANALVALDDVIREMKAAGIPYAVLKGTYLYELLYRDLFPREYEDIDLLVPASRIEDAISALKKAGYGDSRKRSGRSSLPRWHFHMTLTSEKPGSPPIELHRSLVDKANLYRLRDEELFGRLNEFHAGRTSFTVLSAEDQLIYLCLHAAKHGILNFVGLRGGYAAEWYCSSAVGNRLLWFLDIELFLQKAKNHLDWHAVSERAHEWNVSDDLTNCLRVLKLILPWSQAEYAMERLGDRSIEAGSTPRASARDTAVKGAKPPRRKNTLDRMLRSRAGLALLERSMRTNPLFLIRPIRVCLIWRILAPSPTRLLSYHGRESRLWLPWLYLIQPFHMIRKMFAQ